MDPWEKPPLFLKLFTMKIKLISTRFEFEIDGKEFSTVWKDNTDKSRTQQYEVAIYRGGVHQGTFYTNIFINKSNSADLLKESLRAENRME